MKQQVYINGMAAVCAQPTLQGSEIFEAVKEYYDTSLRALPQDYKKQIKPAAMRRMSQAVKMSVFAAKKALEEADITMPSAIITGTGMGCKQDSDVFLDTMLIEEEGLLSPTKFIQSTHNTVGGQLALQLNCQGYNFTYVQGVASFEHAAFDALMSIESEAEDQQILVGGLDELSQNPIGKAQLRTYVKKEPIHNLNLYNHHSPGIIAGEGASFFVFSTEKKDTSFARLIDIEIHNTLSSAEIENVLTEFLARNSLRLEQIDALILGNNGDSDEQDYDKAIAELFPKTPKLVYKHLVGEFYTASAFGFWLGCKILRTEQARGGEDREHTRERQQHGEVEG